MDDNEAIIDVQDNSSDNWVDDCGGGGRGDGLVTVKYGLRLDRKRAFIVFLLFLLNLINYMDRYTIAGL
jgi:hypothetical protein